MRNMSAQDHSDLGQQEVTGMTPSVFQSIERSFRRIRQEVRSEMQGEIQRLETQMTDSLAAISGAVGGERISSRRGPPLKSRELERVLELELKLKGVSRPSTGSLQGKQVPTIVPSSPGKVTRQSEWTVAVGKVESETNKCFGCGEVGHLIQDCSKRNSSPIKTVGELPHETSKRVQDKVFGGDLNIDLTERESSEEAERKVPTMYQAKRVELELS
eukprot:augustus_masked-scaffold_56-processed-gene-1.84-mRNA-1 protein AED:1.00 eAED:1.00 QI:0/0/0/0/1/1/3/0/215